MDSRDHPSELITRAEELEAEGREQIADIFNDLPSKIEGGDIPFYQLEAFIKEAAIKAIVLCRRYQAFIDDETGDAYERAEGE